MVFLGLITFIFQYYFCWMINYRIIVLKTESVTSLFLIPPEAFHTSNPPKNNYLTFCFVSLYFKRNGWKLVVLKKIILNFFRTMYFDLILSHPSKAFSTFLPTQFNLGAPKSPTAHCSVVGTRGTRVNSHLLLEEASLMGAGGCTRSTGAAICHQESLRLFSFSISF